jgi:ribosomal-protein-alanine acetyltransferase
MELIRLDTRHLEGMQRLEELCFPEDPWPASLLASALEGGGVLALGLERDGRLLGSALGRVAADEAELHSIAVEPGLRRGGCGRRLLAGFLAEARSRQARVVWLEVRLSNEAAIRLYESCGFRLTGWRPRYYSDGEDALLLRRDLEEPAA